MPFLSPSQQRQSTEGIRDFFLFVQTKVICMDVANKWRVVINIFVINVIVLCLNVTLFAFSALTLLVGRQEVHPAWGAGVVVGLEQGAVLPMAQLMPLTLTVSCFSKI